MLEQIGAGTVLAVRSAGVAARRFMRLTTLNELDYIAVGSVPIVALTAFFSSVVMSLQIGAQFERFGNVRLVGPVVILAIFKELGPVLAALTGGARVGAGIAARLGSMKVTDQVDAIRATGADPVEKLVSPILVASIFGFPVLTVLADGIGVLGSMVIAAFEYGIDPGYFLQLLGERVRPSDLWTGVGKSFFFGGVVGVVACHQGLSARNGTRGVGDAATRAVVIGAIMVLFVDLIVTTAFHRLGW